MKIFEVDSVLNISATGISLGYPRSFSNKKVFGTKDKAEEHYKNLYNAANLLGIGGYLEAHIHELEIE